MNPTQQQAWKRDALDMVFSALAESDELSQFLVYKGARILALRLGELHRASYDLDANLQLSFALRYPDRAEQVDRLQSLIHAAIEAHSNAQSPVRFALNGVKVMHRPRENHPLGWNAFDVTIQLHDYANEGVRGLPTVTFDIAAPELLGDRAVAPLAVGNQHVYAYTLERIAGEKLRAFLSSLGSYRAKVKKPGESVRAKDIYDLAQILRQHSIADESFWTTAGAEFRLACASRYIDCAGIATFEEDLALTKVTFDNEPVLPKDIAFEVAWAGIVQIVVFLATAGILPFEHPLPHDDEHVDR